jgi:hypothetical protein
VNGGFVLLLAKSSATPGQPQEHERLDGHILGVLDAARTLLQLDGRQFLASLALSSAWYGVIDAAVLVVRCCMTSAKPTASSRGWCVVIRPVSFLAIIESRNL